jgi:hypothetical protein
MNKSRSGLFVSALPSSTMFGLYYSLAVHMYRSLGGWPGSIGELGFPRSLAVHAAITQNFFSLWILLSVFALPVAIALCVAVQQYRRFLPYFALNGLLFYVCAFLMQMAPGPFLYWWRD